MATPQVIALRDTVGYQHAQDDYWYRPVVFGDNLFSYVAHVPPGGDMPADAVEAEEFELSMFMLDGELLVTWGEEQLRVRAGDGLFIPRGVAFGTRNDTAALATFLLSFTPPIGVRSPEEMLERARTRGRVIRSAAEMAAMVGDAPVPGYR